jgi:uncharacterized membrane protein YedE/YeeE
MSVAMNVAKNAAMTPTQETFGTLGIGVAFGFVLSRIGFSSWDDVHAMFTFADMRMFFAFCVAVGALAVGWPLLGRVRFRARPIHKGTVLGGVLFGAGWALCGACPSIALVQLGEGQIAALWTVGGIVTGNALYAFTRARYLRWDTATCVDE